MPIRQVSSEHRAVPEPRLYPSVFPGDRVEILPQEEQGFVSQQILTGPHTFTVSEVNDSAAGAWVWGPGAFLGIYVGNFKVIG